MTPDFQPEDNSPAVALHNIREIDGDLALIHERIEAMLATLTSDTAAYPNHWRQDLEQLRTVVEGATTKARRLTQWIREARYGELKDEEM